MPFAIVLPTVVRAILAEDVATALSTPFRYDDGNDCCAILVAVPAFGEDIVPLTGTRQIGIWPT